MMSAFPRGKKTGEQNTFRKMNEKEAMEIQYVVGGKTGILRTVGVAVKWKMEKWEA